MDYGDDTKAGRQARYSTVTVLYVPRYVCTVSTEYTHRHMCTLMSYLGTYIGR